jgi:catechol 2,3-dioxygenase-like lactoylglutathione lyase family enzyme
MNTFTSAGPVFSHVGIYVRDIAKMENFYRRVMGFIVTDRGSLDTPRGKVDLVFMSRDPHEHHQVVLATGRPEHLDFNLVNQMSFKVPGLPFLRAMYPKLKADKDVTEILPATHGNAISIYFRDPEGTRIECFFDTPWYCEQPMRVAVDMEQSEEQIMAQSEAIARAAPRFQSREQWVAEMTRKMEAGIHA